MNSKKAKALRKMLRNWGSMSEESAKSPEHRFIEKNPGTVIVTKEELVAAGIDPQKYEEANGVTSTLQADPAKNEIRSIYKVKVKTGTISNDPTSKRAIYRHFKEELDNVLKKT